MKNIFYIIPLFWILVVIDSFVYAFDNNQNNSNLLNEARQLSSAFSEKIHTELKIAIKEGGLANAIETCHLKAPDIASDLSKKSKWNLRRTSLKVRDLEDAPDKWELSVLRRFEKQNEEDVDEELMEYSEIVTNQDGEKSFRYMKAITTQRLCLKCHGEKIDKKIRKQLDSLFPFDQATGFTEDDLRGAFSLSFSLRTQN